MSIFGQKGNGLLVAVRGKQKQVDHLRNEVEELKHQLDAERAKNDTLKAKITAYQKNDLSAVKKAETRYEEQLRILNEQIRDYEQMKPELERLRNFFFEQNIGADESDVQAVESDKQEEIAKYKIITVGGHEQLRKNIKDAYPSIMVLDGTPKSQDFHPVENSDYVFILTQHMSHGRRCHRTTIVFKKFCITTRTRQGRSKPFLEREGFGFFVFGGVPPLLMGKSGHRLRFDVIFRNTPAFLAPRSGELPGEARLRGFILPACGRRSVPDRPGCCCPGQICRSGGASSGPAPRTTGLP